MISCCAKCGATKQLKQNAPPKYFALGGTLREKKGKKVCASCIQDIHVWIKDEVFSFKSLL